MFAYLRFAFTLLASRSCQPLSYEYLRSYPLRCAGSLTQSVMSYFVGQIKCPHPRRAIAFSSPEVSWGPWRDLKALATKVANNLYEKSSLESPKTEFGSDYSFMSFAYIRHQVLS